MQALASLIGLGLSIALLEVVVAVTSLTTHVFYHLLVVEEEDLDLLWLIARLSEELIIGSTLAHLMHPIDIHVHILTVLLPDLDHAVK